MADRGKTGCLIVGKARLPYTVVRSIRRRRTIALIIQPEGELRVLAPAGTGLSVIDGLIRRRYGWIVRKLEFLRRRRSQANNPDFTAGADIKYLGGNYRLRVTQEQSRKSGCLLNGDNIEITTDDDSLSPSMLREEVRLELLLWYKKQARREFQARLAVWAARLGVSWGRLVVTSPSRRWGSCSAAGVIRLNWRLIMLPPELIDYVVAHELCHVRHKNHARAFWDCLGKAMPEYKTRRRQLKEWETKGW